MKVLSITTTVAFLISTITVVSGMERTETVFGTPKIVQREFTVTPKECLEKMPTTSAPRQAWKCVFVYPGSTNAFSFNPALETRDKGRISTTSDIVAEYESHPNGGSVGFTAPSATNPGYSRMIPLEEIRRVLEVWSTESWRVFKFRGTYLTL